ncbi:ammonia-forming cytochrome c nitrite reductase subunit c552 [Aliiglaciecola sp. 2_MG-2023]|uniref:ammonia-forming cytochrome c nitrite reductase subunit c552 n=1 Tax=unclassified Aliiglaciecola TaxID=2593648 RepID=UPI0026E2D9D4|nr:MULTISPECIES: ammonia-forming cytochrome c nitrite reductase subunit c552 [unclassified Aliiglaciecola]MDO6710678.1 ammonia-forming cytochrome c nitrite reductase subunit c552 [Aliiglaciecola sp. 2_MG-2023]MDO6751914.1 ammonia-forming cytochrome c nitrite reductase subunit c552 [Aliiglaciecola sp. 1_MG-2023]
MKFVPLLLLLLWFSNIGEISASINATDCVSCHQQAVSDWNQSDHAKAMAIANKHSVLGDFSGVEAEHYSQNAKFYTKNDTYRIRFTENASTNDYEVKFTFGHYPLQQYLIEKDGGRLQVFPFAWDSRTEQNGGQRWYPIYPEEDIKPNDRLHWQQPLQNWNGMCADCHSDGLKRNYNVADNSFDTHWDNINVGCQSCHGKMTEHPKTDSTQTTSSEPLLSKEEQQEFGNWLRTKDDKVAHWQGPPRDNKFMDTCFACHSLRAPLTDGIDSETAFLDQFSPTLLSPPLYHADGHIKEEVYVYGSFLQSKMFAAGVNCLDCHNQHSMKIKVQGNGLCLQCHNPQEYQQPEHIRHPMDSAGAQCVNCHMPETTYMGVDDRRDHNLTVPRPDLSVTYDTPNACNQCHQDQSAQWAAKNVELWHGKPKSLPQGEQAYIDLMHRGYLPQQAHFRLINDEQLSVIKRASAISMLPNSVQQLSDADIQKWVNSEHDLIRLATARIGHLLPPAERLKSYQTLLNDKYKAVRAFAASDLIGLGLDTTAVFKQALDILLTSNAQTQWRGEGNLNQSQVYMKLQQNQQAIDALLHGIEVDPYFDINYVNLVDIYRASQQTDKVAQTLQQGLTANPKSAVLHYAQGLHLIRQQQKLQSIKSFKQAIKWDSQNVQYAYVYFIALDSVDQTKRAVSELKKVIKQYNNAPQLIELGISFSRKIGDQGSFNFFQRLN